MVLSQFRASIQGLQLRSSIFQFRRTKSRIQFDIISCIITKLCIYKKKFPSTTPHDEALLMYVRFHGRQLRIMLNYYYCIVDSMEIPVLHRTLMSM